jgi:hypothetical protein
MSYFDDASLVMIPSGYKDQKVYSVKPLDGSGDLTFSRASSATRVASNGLIEKVRTNVVTYSEAFDNAAWTKGGVGTYTSAVTTGFTDPTGGTNAQRWLATIATTSDRAFIRQLLTLTNGIPYNVSFWIKSNTASAQELYVQFQGGAVATVTATTSWTRVSYTQTTSVTSVFVGVDAKELATDVLIYGYQVEVGDIATDYIATTTAAVSVGPVANVPRLDYLNSSCPRLLLEPQRTNITLFSEQMDNAAWTAINCTVSANAATSPDGYTNADSISTTAANSFFGAVSAVTISADASTYTQSVFVKWVSGSEIVKLRVALTAGTSVAKETIANVRTGVITYTDSTAQIVSYGNGWYRISQQVTNNSTNTNFNYQFYPTSDGTNTNVIRLWGCMAELGAYATSYIPTLGTSVTRVADAASKTSATALIGQTEGTLYAEFDVTLGVDGGEYFLSDGTNVIALQFPPSSPNTIRAIIYNGGGFPVLMDYTYSTAGLHKVAYAYKANDFVLYVDGAQRASDTSGTVPACSIVQFGGMQRVSQALVFKTRLSNSDLAALTA